MFLPQEAGAFGDSIKKESQESRPKLNIYIYIHIFQIITENIFSACNPVQVVVFCKHVLIL